MCTVWHVDKYKITFKLVINHWTNDWDCGTRMEEERRTWRFDWGKLKETDELEDQGVDKITLILIFTWCAVTTWAGFYLAQD